MSFTAEVKEELVKRTDKARHCQLAELAAIIGQNGRYGFLADGQVVLTVEADNLLVPGKAEKLLRTAFDIVPDVSVLHSRSWKGASGILALQDPDEARRVLRATKYMRESGVLLELHLPADNRVVRSECCRRAYLRGIFLCSGSVIDPEKSYHMEIALEDEERAAQVVRLFAFFDVEARMMKRKNATIVYIKGGEHIADAFRLMGATNALMEYENTRILRGIAGKVNRRVNCEAANLQKSVDAGVDQVEEIRLIEKRYGFEKLPASLREAALVRLEYPEASLTELGELMDPPVGKSGMNHRFRRLKMLADELR